MRYKVSCVALLVVAVCASVGVYVRAQKDTRAAQIPVSAKLSSSDVKTFGGFLLEDKEFDGVKIVRSRDEWKKLLTKNQFNILRLEWTEPPYTSKLNDNHEHGVYYCAACGLALFRSENKFDSNTGWPSFYQPAYKKNVSEVVDRSIATEVRTEVECARCRSHLGHVFDDGPKPTGLRYCINGIALIFKKN